MRTIRMWIYKMDKNESSAIILLMFYWHYRTFHLDTVIFNWFLRIDIKCLRPNYFFTVPRFTLEMYRFEYPITFVTSIFASIFTSGILKI